jgi:hypothetical protein
MAPVYSEVLYLGHGITTEDFTVPEGNVWIIKQLTVFVSGTYAGQTQLIDDETDTTIWWQGVVGAGTSTYIHLELLHIVLEPGKTYRWNNDPGEGPGTFDVGLWGYALTTP